MARDVDSVVYYTLTIDKFFDPLDATYLQHLLDQKTDACGYQSDFACPVIVRIYFPQGKEPGKESLVQAIESKNLTFTANDNEFNVKLPYKVITFEEQPGKLSKADYASAMFVPTSSRFNGFSNFSDDVVSQYILTMGPNTAHKARYSYLVSHLSNDSGVIALRQCLIQSGPNWG